MWTAFQTLCQVVNVRALCVHICTVYVHVYHCAMLCNMHVCHMSRFDGISGTLAAQQSAVYEKVTQ